MSSREENSHIQGNRGLGQAIGWFTLQNWIVSVPLTDTQAYDLLVEDPENPGCLKVQVKTTSYRHKISERFQVNLRTMGGNRSGSGKVKKFDRSAVDLLVVWTSAKELYVIPCEALRGVSSITLGSYYDPYRVFRCDT